MSLTARTSGASRGVLVGHGLGLLLFVGALGYAMIYYSDNKPKPPPALAPSQELQSFQVQPKSPDQKVVSIKLLPEKLALEPVQGSSATAAVTVSNNGSIAIPISGIRLASKVDGLVVGGACMTRNILPVGESCNIDVSYDARDLRQVSNVLVVEYDKRRDTSFVEITINTKQPVLPPAPPPDIILPPPPQPNPALEALGRMRDRRANGLEAARAAHARRQPVGETAAQAAEAAYPRTLTTASIPSTESTLPVDRSRIITQDRIIKAVLESTVHTGPAGRTTAVIEMPVYSADGRNILLPAGTRAVGVSGSSQVATQGRVQIVWTRFIRPDGVSVSLEDAQAADAMGRPGAIGEVDRRYLARFGIAMASSVINAAGILAIGGDEKMTVDFGSVTTETTPRSRTARQLQQDLAGVTQQLVREGGELAPIVTIASGSRIDILISQDIYFISPNRAVPLDEKGKPILREDERKPARTTSLNPPPQAPKKQTETPETRPATPVRGRTQISPSAPIGGIQYQPSPTTDETLSPQAQRLLLPPIDGNY